MSIFDDLFADDDDSYGGRAIATKLDSRKASELFISFTRGDIDAAAFDAALEECVVCRGMTADEIKRYFPPQHVWKDEKEYNRTKLIKAIIREEVRLVGKSRPAANVRNFWYTNLMYTIMKVMGDTNVESIMVGYNTALRELVREGFRYADINLISEKSELCKAIFADSPYPNIILACEKASYHQYLQRLADIFHVTFISLGGQGSYQVFEDLVVQFIQTGIDIDQEFFLYCISDFDPEGYDIEATAKRHLEAAGLARVTIRRVYIREDQLTKGLVDRAAIPYSWHKSKDSYSKGALTKYNRFGFLTGGIYKLGDIWRRFSKNGNGYEVPIFVDNAQGYDLYRLELDNFLPEILAELLIDALEKDIDGAEYFRQKMRLYLAERLPRHANAAFLAEKKAYQKIDDIDDDSDRLEASIKAKQAQFTQKYEEVDEAVDKTRRANQETFTAEIDSIEEEIDELEEEKKEIDEKIENLRAEQEYQQERWREYESRIIEIECFLQEVNDMRNLNVASVYVKWGEEVNQKLNEYVLKVTEDCAPMLLEKFNDLVDKVVSKLDFSANRKDVFNAARQGKESFAAKLGDTHKIKADGMLSSESDTRFSELLKDQGIAIPDMENEEDIVDAISRLRSEIEAAQPAELGDELKLILSGLIKVCDEKLHPAEFEALFDPDNEWEDVIEMLKAKGVVDE